MPAQPRPLGLYLTLGVMDNGYRTSTMRVYSAGVSAYHRLYGQPDPKTHQVTNLLRGLDRMYGRAYSQAPGLLAEHLDVIRRTEFPQKPGESPGRRQEA